jgi:uncharacterized protein (TIGR03032 family)
MVQTDLLTRRLYANDASMYEELPQGVCFPETEQDIVDVVMLAAETGVPITARAAGTSLAGQTTGGGIVMDTTTNEILLAGLAMPHSPRWYDDKLWVLESGAGTIGHVDMANRVYNPVAEVPGFTRGLDFCGPVAFVGLSQVRESAVFSGIPITERKQERTCGVWAIHMQTGQILGFVKFEDAVQEIFAVRVVPEVRWPDLVNHDTKLLDGSFILPDADLQRVPDAYRKNATKM